MIQNSTILCSNCGKDSGVEASDSFGVNAARAHRAGFIPKDLFLYTGHNDCFIACSPECRKILTERIFKEREVSEEKRAELKEFFAEQKAKIPAEAKETAEAVGNFQKLLKRIKKK